MAAIAPIVVLGCKRPPSLQGILYVEGGTYKNLAGALAACPASGPLSGGCRIVDTMPETFTANPFLAISQNGNIEIDFAPGRNSGMWLADVPLVITQSGVLIRCTGRGVVIGAGPRFPNNVRLLQIGDGSPNLSVHSTRVEDCVLDGGGGFGLTGTTTFAGENLAERSGLRNVALQNY